MTDYPQFLVTTQGYPGYWGRGATVEQAVRNAKYIKPGTPVRVFACVPDAYVDAMGNCYGIHLASHQVGRMGTRGRITKLRPVTEEDTDARLAT